MNGKLHILCGEDEFSTREALEQVKSGLGPREAVAPNTTMFDGARLSYPELEMACNTVPFLAEFRLVVTRGLLERFEERAAPRSGRRPGKAGSQKTAEAWSKLPDLIARMPPTTTLVLLEGRLGAKNTMLEQIKPLATMREFPVLKGAELQGWIRARIAHHNGSITADANRLLADFVGGDLRQLDNELQKLCTYAGAAAIDVDAVRLLVGDTREAGIFTLVDGVAQGNHSQATRILRQLMDQGEPGPKILATLAQQLRMMIQVKSLTASGASQADIMRITASRSDYAVQKARQNGRAFRLEDLTAMYRRLLETDLAIKTGAVSEGLGLEMLIVELSNRPGAGARG